MGIKRLRANAQALSGLATGEGSGIREKTKKAGLSLKGKTHLVFWLKAQKEEGWQHANPVVTLHETDAKFLRLQPVQDFLGKPAFNEAREGWWYVVVPLAGDALWKQEGMKPDLVQYLTIGFDTWNSSPLDLWIDGLGLR